MMRLGAGVAFRVADLGNLDIDIYRGVDEAKVTWTETELDRRLAEETRSSEKGR